MANGAGAGGDGSDGPWRNLPLEVTRAKNAGKKIILQFFGGKKISARNWFLAAVLTCKKYTATEITSRRAVARWRTFLGPRISRVSGVSFSFTIIFNQMNESEQARFAHVVDPTRRAFSYLITISIDRKTFKGLPP
ncbi:hypothetical protein Fcan01_26015 [Folsomia candida]|uniref:Uncharacterized protein n=1 Tax=Folsomia candida TaxID=158441 RepID=A0A226D3L3_FOLCA|nr:hypothetical protein Fcan01_26015 [Folsomia candida]